MRDHRKQAGAANDITDEGWDDKTANPPEEADLAGAQQQPSLARLCYDVTEPADRDDVGDHNDNPELAPRALGKIHAIDATRKPAGMPRSNVCKAPCDRIARETATAAFS